MFFLRQPSPEAIRQFISSQRELPFSYAEVGATARELPADYIVDHNRIKLGTGKEIYERAIAALRNWKQFDLGWVKILPDETPLEVGATVVIQAKAFGFWSLSASRIVYLIDEDAPLKRFRFAYGTLPDHVERGEERFTIEWDAGADSVWYEILAFSRPKHPLVRLGFPLARMLQKRFARESLAVMARSVHADGLQPLERSKRTRG
jgi:uncharacterized protein (UPF0548 family)